MELRSPPPSGAAPELEGDADVIDLRDVRSRGPRHGYCVITAHPPDDPSVHRAWLRTAGDQRAGLLGEYATLEEAKASLDVEWHAGTMGPIEAWAFLPAPRRVRRGRGRSKRPQDRGSTQTRA